MNNSDKPINPYYPNRPWNDESANGFQGLTKREYFAGLAMQAMISNPNIDTREPEWLIKHSIRCADELLKQLEK